MAQRLAAACCLACGLAAGLDLQQLEDTSALLQAQVEKSLSSSQEPTISSTFVDNKGYVCVEGPERIVEGALAMKKAAPTGGLYNLSYARSGQSCADRGYSFEGGKDECFPGVQLLFRSEVGRKRFAVMEKEALQAFQAEYSVGEEKASLMVSCTCHPESPTRVGAGHLCDFLNAAMVGSWVHKNPKTGKTLVCDQGPFEYTTRALATIKSSPLSPMHNFDQISPVPCSQRGFPLMYGAIDHCYPKLKMWTRTEQPMHNCPKGGLGPDNPDCDDWGVVEAGQVEKALYMEKGFEAFARAHSLSTVLFNNPGCNCKSDSMVIHMLRKRNGSSSCTRQYERSPVRDFWMA